MDTLYIEKAKTLVRSKEKYKDSIKDEKVMIFFIYFVFDCSIQSCLGDLRIGNLFSL